MKKNMLTTVFLVFLAVPCLAGSLDDIRKAAEQGNAEAQFKLGAMYRLDNNDPYIFKN